MSSSAPDISTRDLIHSGLQNLSLAAQLFDNLHNNGVDAACIQQLLTSLSLAYDPDVALRNLVDIVQGYADSGLKQLLPDSDSYARLIQVLGASDGLGKLMRSRPYLVKAAATTLTKPMTQHERTEAFYKSIQVQISPEGYAEAGIPLAQATSALRAQYYEQLASIVAYDVCSPDAIAVQPTVSRWLSDLADSVLQTALAIARKEVAGSRSCAFTVISMGKLGAQELNYVSDVDLIYVVEPVGKDVQPQALSDTGSKMATLLQRVCQSIIPDVAEPPLWQIDAGLRPEGKNGPLVRRLDSHQGYYEQWAENWEFQALLKARYSAGDADLGNAYIDMTQAFVWKASQRDGFVYDCQQMRKRVEQHIPEALKDREIKLGRGGLRDVEFTVQMLQLVHGRADRSLRMRSTLDALHALAAGGYVSRVQAAKLSQDYRFERVLEHRQQLWALKRTHLFPDLGKSGEGGLERKREITIEQMSHNDELRRLARVFRIHPEDLVGRYDDTRREVRHLHLDIYYRPMLPISAQYEGDEIALSPQATRDRFESIGFADPDSAIRHVTALTSGVSRSAKIHRILLPAALQWLGQGQNPDMGLLYWSKLAEQFGSGSNYLGFLRDSPSAASRLCHVLSNSRFLGDALNKSAESVTWLGDDVLLERRSRASLDVQCEAIIERHSQALNECANALRAMRRHEIERIGLGWMSQVISDDECLTGMTDVYDAILDAAVTWSIRHQVEVCEYTAPLADITAIAMGRYGGHEVNFSSDADIIMLYREREQNAEHMAQVDAHTFARDVVDDIRALLQGASTLEPKIDVDFDLRPEGKNGPLIRSYDSCVEYYGSWSSTWEHQALIRARYAAGDPNLAQDFLEKVADPLRYPAVAPQEQQIAEIRTLKARMEAERLPRGVRRERHLKLGKGGLSDVEWTVQLMQLQYAGKHVQLRVHSTLKALDVLEELGLMSIHDAQILRTAWLMCTRARNGNYLWSGRAAQADILPSDIISLGGIGTYLQYDAHQGQHFENDVLSVMRKCREVVERLFYGSN